MLCTYLSLIICLFVYIGDFDTAGLASTSAAAGDSSYGGLRRGNSVGEESSPTPAGHFISEPSSPMNGGAGNYMGKQLMAGAAIDVDAVLIMQ